MPAPGLHPHQHDLVARVDAAFEAGARAVVMQSPTGSGKTHTAAEMIRRRVALGRRVIFVAHLETLLDDTRTRLLRAGILCGVVQADRPVDPAAPVQVCSAATMVRRPNDRPPADDVYVDECHRAAGAGQRAILKAYPRARITGLTATPGREDGQPLDMFDVMVRGPSIAWLTERAFLVPAEVIAPEGPEDALACCPWEALDRWSPNGRAIVFAANVAHAEALAAMRPEYARVLTGETSREERAEIREWIAEESGRAIINVNVCIEGFDAPTIDTVVLARAFGSLVAYLQAIGRGLRPCSVTGKTRCAVIDLRGAVYSHGLPADERRWSLQGSAAVLTGEALAPLARCRSCLAVFPPARRCPRCGAESRVIAKVPRVLSRAEQNEVAMIALSKLTPEQLDSRLYWGKFKPLVNRFIQSGKPLAQAQYAADAMAKRFVEQRKARLDAWRSDHG